MMLYTHCAPLERGDWTHRDSINIALLWSGKIAYIGRDQEVAPTVILVWRVTFSVPSIFP